PRGKDRAADRRLRGRRGPARPGQPGGRRAHHRAHGPGAGAHAAACRVPGGVPAARRRGAGAPGSRRGPGDRRGHVEVAGAQGTAAAEGPARTLGPARAGHEIVTRMFCRQYNEAIQELAEGTLGPVRRAELQTHLDRCDECRALAADLQKIRAAASALPPVQPPPQVWKRVARQLQQEGRMAAPQASRTTYATLLAIAATLVVA